MWPIAGAAGFGLAAALVVVAVMGSSEKTPPRPIATEPVAASAMPSAIAEMPEAPVTSAEPVASTSAPSTTTRPPPRRRVKPTSTSADCKVPYTVDAEGRTIWRRECFKQ